MEGGSSEALVAEVSLGQMVADGKPSEDGPSSLAGAARGLPM